MKDITFPKFKLYLKAIVILTARFWNKDTASNQWSGIKNPETESQAYDVLIFNKGTKKS